MALISRELWAHQPCDMPLGVAQDFGMENPLRDLLGCHFRSVFLWHRLLLWHGEPMSKQVRSAVDLLSVVNRYGTDDECRAYLTELRWPSGVGCPNCQSKIVFLIAKRHQFDCDSCRYQFSVLSGTMFHDTHLALD